MDVGAGKVDTISSPGTPGDSSHASLPDSLSLPVQVPSSPKSPMQHPAPKFSSDRNCWQPQDPKVDRTQYRKLPWSQLHEQCSGRGYHQRELTDVLKTRLASMGAADAKRLPVADDDTDTSETINSTRERAHVEGQMDSDIPTQ